MNACWSGLGAWPLIRVALGFATTETLAAIQVGVFLTTGRPVRVGDRVQGEFISGERRVTDAVQ